MRTARRALKLLLTPSRAWADIAADGDTYRSQLKGHALLLLAPVLAFIAYQLAVGGLRPEVSVGRLSRFGMDGALVGSGPRVSLTLSGGQTALFLFSLCLAGAALMYWLVLTHAARHGAEADRGAALRLVLYAMTPGILGSLLFALPLVGWLLAIVGYWLTVRLFRSGAPLLLPPLPEEATRFGRVVGRRAAILGLALPLVALIAGGLAFSAHSTPLTLPGIAT